MAVSSDTNQTADILTAKPQDIAVNFQFYVASDLIVIHTDQATLVDTVLSISTHYTITGGSGSTGTVTILDTSAVATGDTITVFRRIPYTQTFEPEEGGLLSAAALEQRFDRTVIQILQLKAQIDRCLRLGETSQQPDAGDIKDLTSKFLAFDANDQLTGYTAAQMLTLIGISATVNAVAFWADDAARALEAPGYVGQLGVQIDTGDIYRGTGLLAGNWTAGALNPANNLSDVADAATARANIGASDLTVGVSYAINLILG